MSRIAEKHVLLLRSTVISSVLFLHSLQLCSNAVLWWCHYSCCHSHNPLVHCRRFMVSFHLEGITLAYQMTVSVYSNRKKLNGILKNKYDKNAKRQRRLKRFAYHPWLTFLVFSSSANILFLSFSLSFCCSCSLVSGLQLLCPGNSRK